MYQKLLILAIGLFALFPFSADASLYQQIYGRFEGVNLFVDEPTPTGVSWLYNGWKGDPFSTTTTAGFSGSGGWASVGDFANIVSAFGLTDGNYWIEYKNPTIAPYSNYRYFKFTVSGGQGFTITATSTLVASSTSYIIHTDPTHKETRPTTTSFQFGTDVFLLPQDFATGTRVIMEYQRNSLSQGTLGISSIWNSFTFPLIRSGFSSFSTTTSIVNNATVGEYTMRTRIEKPFLFFFYQTITSTTTRFTVVERNAYDEVIADPDTILGDAIDVDCQLDFSGLLSFNFTDNAWKCLAQIFIRIFVPSPQQVATLIDDFRNKFLLKAPWGYAVRVYDILQATTTPATLPSLAFTLPAVLPVDGTIDFTPWNYLAGEDSYLATTIPEGGSEPILPTMLLYWNRFIALVFAFWLIRRILNAWHLDKEVHSHKEEEQ